VETWIAGSLVALALRNDGKAASLICPRANFAESNCVIRDALKAQARNPWGHITSGDMDSGFARCTRAPE